MHVLCLYSVHREAWLCSSPHSIEMEGICAQEKRNDSNFPRKGEKKSKSKHHTLLTLYRGITLSIIHRLAKGGFQMLDLSCWKENSRILSWKNFPFYIHHLRLGGSLYIIAYGHMQKLCIVLQ